jgi:hypothetical protein
MALQFIFETQHNPQQLSSFTHIFGYMGEINHGWFYVFGFPVFLLLWFRCLTSLSLALENLATRKRLLTRVGKVTDPIQIIADKNRKWMNPVFVFAVPFFIVLDLIGEGKSIVAVSKGYEFSNAWDIGHIQANQMP